MSLEVKHLTHTYSAGSAFQATAVHDVSLTIEDGEFVCIVGHTGSGKSTLVQHLNGLLKPTSGQVLVDGEDMNGENVDRRRIRQKVGLVFQYPEYQLFEETIAKDIAFGPKNQGLSEEEIDQRVRRAMAHVHLDYDKYAERSPFDLSGGQMRRVAIAGVLAMEPKVLILDDSTSAVDTATDARIREAFAKKIPGTTKLIVAQRISSVQEADRILVLDNGRVNAFDTHENLLKSNPIYQEIYASQMKGGEGHGVPATEC